MSDTVDIIVPVHNEEASIDEFYTRVSRLGYAGSLIFVDNASTDGTLERLARYPVRVIRHASNLGYGASVRDGYAASNSDVVVIIDADLEYPPERIPALLAAVADDHVVYCSRFLGSAPPRMPVLRRLGNRLVSGLYNVLFGQRTTDFYTGMKAFRRDQLAIETLRKDGFEHGPELGALIYLSGHRIREIPVEYTPRRRGRSKMRHIPEFAKFVFYLLLYWWRCVVRGRPLIGG